MQTRWVVRSWKARTYMGPCGDWSPMIGDAVKYVSYEAAEAARKMYCSRWAKSIVVVPVNLKEP